MPIALRKHQRETVEVCQEILEGKPIREIILSVTPGGGKSFVPVIIAENLIPAIADKICWVVPRNSLKYQGEDEFCDRRWQTKKRIIAAENGGDLSCGLAGYTTTYQAVGVDPRCHAAEFRKFKYILFLDEFHHIAEGSEWHRAIQPLVDSAVVVIKASGTLSRGDGQKIAFLEYANGEPFLETTDNRRVIVYGRRAAIAEGAIMPVKFELVDGEATWQEMDGHESTSKLSGEESAKALFTALRTEFADHILEKATKEYLEIAYNYREAKMLVVAPNIEIAKTYFDFLARRGLPARIATSEDTQRARINIAEFKRGVYDILVTVAMAYEGLNVPQIAVICCLSHIRSAPWLEQCFARANRIAPRKYDAVVIAPADWSFKKTIRMIESEQLVPLGNPEGQQELIMSGGQPKGGGEQRPWIIPVSSSANIAGVNPMAPEAEPPPCSPSEAKKILRHNINWHITLFLNRQNAGNKLAQSKMLYRRMRLICAKPLAEMNQSELEKVWTWVRKEFGGGH
jgi:superfamily II DNA or RNA helicase